MMATNPSLRGQPAFPDHPITEKEFRQTSRELAGISSYTIKERCSFDRIYELDATSEDDAWEKFEAGGISYYDEEEDCYDADITKVGP